MSGGTKFVQRVFECPFLGCLRLHAVKLISTISTALQFNLRWHLRVRESPYHALHIVSHTFFHKPYWKTLFPIINYYLQQILLSANNNTVISAVKWMLTRLSLSLSLSLSHSQYIYSRVSIHLSDACALHATIIKLLCTCTYLFTYRYNSNIIKCVTAIWYDWRALPNTLLKNSL